MAEVNLKLNTQELRQELKQVNNEIDETNQKGAVVLKNVQKNVKLTRQQVVGLAQASWGVITGMLEAAGITISTQFKVLISSAFAAINILTPLLTAQAVTPGMQIQAALGFINLALAVASIGFAQAQEAELAAQLASGMQALNSVNGMIGMMNW